MSYKKEVEIKIRIKQFQIKTLKKKLISLGAIFKEKSKDSDTYFTAPHRDFIKTKECLRIREKDNGYLELTYKGPSDKSMKSKKQFWKKEIDIPLSSSKQEVKALLESLDFTKVAEVIKEREKFVLGRQSIVLDKVKKAGWFVEIENTADNQKNKEEAVKENLSLLKELGLDEKDIVDEPYRDLVLKSK